MTWIWKDIFIHISYTRPQQYLYLMMSQIVTSFQEVLENIIAGISYISVMFHMATTSSWFGSLWSLDVDRHIRHEYQGTIISDTCQSIDTYPTWVSRNYHVSYVSEYRHLYVLLEYPWSVAYK